MENEAGNSQGEALKNMLVAGILAVFTLALYAQLLFTNRVFASGDILYYFYPYRALAAEALRQGELPLWNPYIFMGAPFLANPQAAVLYPLHWPLSFLTVTQQVYWSAALHTWILGMGGYALMRVWRRDRLSSLVTGLVLAGSGFYGGLLGHLNQMNGAAWLPWALVVVERVRGELGAAGPGRFTAGGWWRGAATVGWRVGWRVGWLSLLVTLMLLAGHTQTVYINLFGVGAWLAAAGGLRLWQLRRDGLFARRHLAEPAVTLGVLGAACVLGAMASAAQLLPTLELSELGLRSGGLSYGEASSFSLRPLLLGWTLLPSYGLADLGVVFGTLGYTEYVAYVGLVGMTLAAGALWQAWRALRATGWTDTRSIRSSGMSAAGTPWVFGLFLAGLGLFLALGRWNPVYYLLYVAVPGFDLFRAPARWMMLYTLGMAVLAGLGSGLLHAWLAARWANRPRMVGGIVPAVLILLVAGDLIVAARALPHTQLTAPQAVYDVRTAPAHIRTEAHADARPENVDENVDENVGPGAQGRFLSMSALAFDPGDMADYRRILLEGPAPSLTPATFHDLVVALKAQEILAPNLAMLWQIPGVDGFDGGTLPLQRYNEFLTLLIPPDRLVPDGRVREQLTQVPPAHLLDLLNVQYVITDKVHDLWFDGVYYDRQMGAVLAAPAAEADNLGPADILTMLHVDVPQAFPATHIDLIGALIPPPGQESPRAVEAVEAAPIARVAVYDASGLVETRVLTGGGTPGAHWADAMLDSTAVADATLDSPAAQQSGAVVAWTGVEEGAQAYRARLPLISDAGDGVMLPERLEIEAISGPLFAAGYRVHVQAITLYHAPTGMFLALTPSPAGRLQFVHSGDVKVYEQRGVLSRVYWVPQAVGVSDGAAALHALARPDFDPTTGVVLESAVPNSTLPWTAEEEAWGGTDSPVMQEQAEVTLLAYAPERVAARVVSQSPGVLVISDAYYPGWQAWVDDTPAHIYPANHLFRGVIVPPGDHIVTLRFRPASFTQGLWWSGAGLALIGGLLLFSRRRTRTG